MTVDSLSERDWRFAFDIVYRLNSTEGLDEFRQTLLKMVNSVIASDQIMFNLVEEQDGDFVYTGMDYIGMKPRLYEKFQSNLYNDENTLLGVGAYKDTTVFRDSDLLSKETLLESKLYREIFLEHGFRYVMRAFFVQSGRTIGALGLFRGERLGEFADRDMRVLKMLSPHITQKLSRVLNCSGHMPRKSPLLADHERIRKLGLTPREVEILEHIAKHLDDSEIAERLVISPYTVKSTFRTSTKKQVSRAASNSTCCWIQRPSGCPRPGSTLPGRSAGGTSGSR